MHASDGHGNNGGISPVPLPRRLNLSTLGVSVASRWRGKDVNKSEASFATPIAAALVANALDIVRLHRGPASLSALGSDMLKNIHTFDTVQEILQELTTEVQDYNYLSPNVLLDVDGVTRVVINIVRGVA